MTIAVGILSASHVHTDAYAAELSAREDVDLVGVADPDVERGRTTAARHGTDYVADADALIDRIDGGVICAPNVAHREWIERAVEADLDVLCEKPLAPTVADARAIVEKWKTSDSGVGVAMPLRWSEPVRRAKAALEAGVIGSLHSISGTNRGHMPGGWFVDPELSGGGAVMDHTVHIVDIVSYLTGESVEEVYAEVGTRFHDGPLEDVNVLSMELSDGTQFLLDGSWSKPDEWHTWGDATVDLFGMEGAISVDCTGNSMTNTVANGSDGGVQTVPYGMDTTARLISDFVTAVQERRDPLVTPDDGLAVVRTVEAAYESAELGKPVVVEY